MAAPPGPPAPPSGGAPPVACPQCGNFWGAGSLFVRDSCGHRKCRGCVIVEGNECGTCSLRGGAGGSPAAGGSAGLPACKNEAGIAVATSGAFPVPEATPNGAQTVDIKVKSSPSYVTASSTKKKDLPQQSTGKKVLDELNVTNANNVVDLPCEDSADAEAVDDPDRPPEGKRPAAKRPSPPAHGVIKLPGLPVTYCCTICGHKFKSRSTVRYHYYCGVENKPLTCELCKKGFVSKSHYQYHMRDHAGDLPFKCDVCGKGFKQKTKLKRHTIVHTDDRKFKCSTCGKHFAEASNLKVHSRLHTGERPYKCDQCGRSFNERANFNKHVRSIHTNERPYACEMCGKCFTRSENLKVHLRRHKGIRPYECPVCSLTFSYKKDMTRHMPVHDSSVRPFECDKCSQTFKRKDNLLRHVKLSHNENEKDDESPSVPGGRSAGAKVAPPREHSAAVPGKARTLEPGEDKTEDKAREEANKCARPQNSTPAGNALTDSSIAPRPVDEAAKPDAIEQSADVSTACGSISDSNSSRPLRKRRVRVPPDASACSSLPVFRRNVTPPPGALPEPPRVPRHCLPAPRERHAVLRPPVPVDFLETTGEKKAPRTRATGRKRSKRELETDTTDIEKVGFIQVPQYPLRTQPAPRPVPARAEEAAPPGAGGGARPAETCGAVPVIRRPQPSNCVRTITRAPQQAVSTIVSPGSRQPAHTAPPLPPLPACSPRPDQPMLRLLLHDTPCSDTPQPPPVPVPAPVRPETPPAPPTAALRSAEGLGLCDVYECILKGNLGQLTGRRLSSTDRQREPEWRLPSAGAPAAPPVARLPSSAQKLTSPARERTAALPQEPCRVAQNPVPVRQDRPAGTTKRVPVAEKQLGTVEGHSGTAEVRSVAAEESEPVAPKELAFAHRHFPTVQSVEQSYREQQQTGGQLPLWPSLTPLSTGKGTQKMIVDGKQPPSENSTCFDTYCSFVRVRAKKQSVFCGKKSGKRTFIEEEQQHSVYTEVRRPGKQMTAISGRLSDDNEEDDDEALNCTLYGSGSGGKRLPSSGSDRLPDTDARDGYRRTHCGSRGDKAVDMFDVIAELKDYTADPAVPFRSGGVETTDGIRDLSLHQNVAAQSSGQQPHVIVGTGKLCNVQYS